MAELLFKLIISLFLLVQMIYITARTKVEPPKQSTQEASQVEQVESSVPAK